MCVSGGWTESYQTRSVFGARTVMDMAFLIWLSGRSRANKPVPRWAQLAAVVTASLAAIFTYNDQIKRFWDEIHDDWFAHERTLDENPRSRPTG